MKRIICLVFGHKYYRVRNLHYMSELIGCSRCKNYYAMNHDVRALLPFDEELYQLYRSFGLRGLKKYVTHDKMFNLLLG